MRTPTVLHGDVNLIPGLIVGLIGLIFVVMVLFHLPAQPKMWLYPLVRQAAQAKVNYETRNMAVLETAHFSIKYTPVDEGMVKMVADAAETAYVPVTDALGYVPAGKTTIIVYPDKSELRKAFGWSGDQSAMGVYWGGVIQLLSPRVWLKDGDSVAEFIHSGPMVHEYTHLVFDHITSGNYPRWFTEGLAQYLEYRVNQYEWLTPENTLDHKLYTMAELDNSFDDLDNQALSYRESLAAVRYIADVHGEAKLRQVIGALQAGQSMKQAIASVLGMDYTTYETAWQQWAVVTMQNDAKKQ
jgi:hypothetical protein